MEGNWKLFVECYNWFFQNIVAQLIMILSVIYSSIRIFYEETNNKIIKDFLMWLEKIRIKRVLKLLKNIDKNQKINIINSELKNLNKNTIENYEKLQQKLPVLYVQCSTLQIKSGKNNSLDFNLEIYNNTLNNVNLQNIELSILDNSHFEQMKFYEPINKQLKMLDNINYKFNSTISEPVLSDFKEKCFVAKNNDQISEIFYNIKITIEYSNDTNDNLSHHLEYKSFIRIY